MVLITEDLAAAGEKPDCVSVQHFLGAITYVVLDCPYLVESGLLVKLIDYHDLFPLHLHAMACDSIDDQELLIRGSLDHFLELRTSFVDFNLGWSIDESDQI